jgi:PAS domain S-box-containing protein
MPRTASAKPPQLPDEKIRLASLRALRVLDTAADPDLDVVTRLAADRFDTAIALVSLVDDNRQWFKSRFGLETTETPRSDSFCAHTIAGERVMVVTDATQDSRFKFNPLVTGEQAIRFYAGAPLTTSDGHRIGTLCVIDNKPRAEFTDRDERTLELMAGQVMSILESSRIRREQQISQLIAETTTDAFICTDASSTIILWNRAAEAMFGWPAEYALGRSLDLIIPMRHRQGHNAGMQRLRNGAAAKLVGQTVEVPAKRKDGTELPVELSLGMWPAEGKGEPEGFAAIIRDITARNAAEEERAATEARMAQQIAAIDATDDGIALTDADGAFIFMNRAHASMFGYQDPAELIGRPWSCLYDPSEALRIEEQVMPVLAEAGQWRGETLGRRRNGGLIEQEIALSLSAEGGIVCVSRNIGERQTMHREKARLREQLMVAQRQEAVGHLASGIAHDFNNLIAAIAGTAGLLELSDDHQVQFHALRIQKAASTAAGLVEKLLSVGRREPVIKTIDLRDTLTSVRDLLVPSLADPLHRIDLELPVFPMLARADATEVMQVALNLALNARDALPVGREGRIIMSIGEALDREPASKILFGSLPDKAALIRVSDTGCGIAQTEIAQVFEPFYTRKGDNGTGLGLAVVAGIVANAGGAISLTSRPGLGTVFEIWWPLEALDVMPDAPTLAPGSGAIERVVGDKLSGRTVLVVDDDPVVVDTLAAMLERAGAEPGPCLSAEDALAAVREDPYAWDLVITDYDMPGMNGAALARALRAIRPDLPLLLLTALPQMHRRQFGEKELFDASLGKPTDCDTLVAVSRLAMAAAQERTESCAC